MKKLLPVFFVTFVLFILSVKTSYAAIFVLPTGEPQVLNASDEYSLNSSLSINAGNGTAYYLRGVFFKPNTNSYCGFTWNGDDWFSGPYGTTSSEGWKHFYKIVINNNSWSGTLKVKFDSDDSGCKETGTYRFKIQRFTATSGSGNFDSQNEMTFEVTVPTPTPTVVPTDEPTKTPIPTKIPTSTSSPTPKSLTTTKIPTPTKSSTAKSTQKKTTPTVKPKRSDKAVLGNSTKSAKKSASPTPTQKKEQVLVNGFVMQNLPAIFIIVGGLLIIGCGILIFLKDKKKEK